VSASEDNSLKLWDAATGRLLRTLQGHSKSVTSVAFSPDGRYLVSGSEDNSLKLWDVATGRLLRTLQGHSKSVTYDEVLEWVREALHASHADQRREHQEAVERLRAEHKRLGERISAMYIDKLDGKIGGDFYDQMASEWRSEQARCQREIDRHEAAEQSYMDEGVQILELARNAQRLFERQEPRQKRRLLNFVLSNCTWEDGEVVATFRQPFDLLVETAVSASHAAADEAAKTAKSEIWLPGPDSNQRPTGQQVARTLKHGVAFGNIQVHRKENSSDQYCILYGVV
jgi:hypothetical protein